MTDFDAALQYQGDSPFVSQESSQGWLSYFEMLFTKSQEGMVGVLIVMNKDTRRKAATEESIRMVNYYFVFGSTVVDSFQMLSFIFRSHDDQAMEGLYQLFDIFEFSQLFILWIGFLLTLIFTSLLVGLILVNAVYVGYCWANQKVQSVYSSFLLRHSSSLLMGVFYIPILSVFAKALTCRVESSADGEDTTDTLSPNLCAPMRPAIIILCFLFIGLSLTVASSFFDSNPRSKAISARPHSRVELVQLLTKTITTVGCTLVCGQSDSVILRIGWSFTLMVLFSYLGYMHIWYQPYYSLKIVYVKAVLTTTVAWISVLEFCHMVIKVVYETMLEREQTLTNDEILELLENSDFQYYRAMLLVFAILTWPLAMIRLISYRRKSLQHLKYTDCTHVLELEVRARVDSRKLQKLIASAADHRMKDGTLSTAENDKALTLEVQKEYDEILERMLQGFKYGLKRFPHSSLICTFYIEALVAYSDPPKRDILIRHAILQAEARNPPIDVRLALQRKREYLKQQTSGNNGVTSYALAQQHEQVGRQCDQNACQLLSQFWSLIASRDDTQFRRLLRIAAKVAVDIRRAQQSYKALTKLQPKEIDTLNLHAGFLRDVCNNIHEAKRVDAKVARALQEERMTGFRIPVRKHSLWGNALDSVSRGGGKNKDNIEEDEDSGEGFEVDGFHCQLGNDEPVVCIAVGTCENKFGTILSCNDSAEELIGTRKKDLVGDSFQRYIVPPFSISLRELINDFFESGESSLTDEGIRTVLKCNKGKLLLCYMQFVPITRNGMEYQMFVRLRPSSIPKGQEHYWDYAMILDQNLNIVEASSKCISFVRDCTANELMIAGAKPVSIKDVVANYSLAVPVTLHKQTFHHLVNPSNSLDTKRISITEKRNQQQPLMPNASRLWQKFANKTLFHFALTYVALSHGQSRGFTKSRDIYDFPMSVIYVRMRPLVKRVAAGDLGGISDDESMDISESSSSEDITTQSETQDDKTESHEDQKQPSNRVNSAKRRQAVHSLEGIFTVNKRLKSDNLSRTGSSGIISRESSQTDNASNDSEDSNHTFVRYEEIKNATLHRISNDANKLDPIVAKLGRDFIFTMTIGFLFALVMHLLLNQSLAHFSRAMNYSRLLGEQGDIVATIGRHTLEKFLVTTQNGTFTRNSVFGHVAITNMYLEQYASLLQSNDEKLFEVREELTDVVAESLLEPVLMLPRLVSGTLQFPQLSINSVIQEIVSLSKEIAWENNTYSTNEDTERIIQLFMLTGSITPPYMENKTSIEEYIFENMYEQTLSHIPSLNRLWLQLLILFGIASATQIYILFRRLKPVTEHIDTRKLRILKAFVSLPTKNVNTISRRYQWRLCSVHNVDEPFVEVPIIARTLQLHNKKKSLMDRVISTRIFSMDLIRKKQLRSRSIWGSAVRRIRRGSDSSVASLKTKLSRFALKLQEKKEKNMILRKLGLVCILALAFYFVYIYFGFVIFFEELNSAPRRLLVATQLTYSVNYATLVSMLHFSGIVFKFNSVNGEPLYSWKTTAETKESLEDTRELLFRISYDRKKNDAEPNTLPDEKLLSYYQKDSSPRGSFALDLPSDEYHKLMYLDGCTELEKIQRDWAEKLSAFELRDPLPDGVEGVYYQSEDCETIDNGILTLGLKGSTDKFAQATKNMLRDYGIDELLLSSIRNGTFFQKKNIEYRENLDQDHLFSSSYYLQLLNSANMLHILLRRGESLLEQGLAETILQSQAYRYYIIVSFIMVFVFVYVFAVRQFLFQINRDLNQMQSLLLTIPDDVVENSRKLRTFIIEELKQ